MSRDDLLSLLRVLDRELAPAPWIADIDDPGTPNESWTGRWLAGPDQDETAGPVGATNETPQGGVKEADALAALRNSIPDVIAFLEGN